MITVRSNWAISHESIRLSADVIIAISLTNLLKICIDLNCLIHALRRASVSLHRLYFIQKSSRVRSHLNKISECGILLGKKLCAKKGKRPANSNLFAFLHIYERRSNGMATTRIRKKLFLAETSFYR